MTSSAATLGSEKWASQRAGAARGRESKRGPEQTGARAAGGRDGQHLGQLPARGPGLWLSAGRALPPQCTAAPPAGGGDPSRLSSSLVPEPARRSAAEGAGRFYRFHPSRKDGRGSQRER